MNDESKFEQAKGNVKETIGNATDNEDLEKEGKQDKASGKVNEAIDKVADTVKDKVSKFTK